MHADAGQVPLCRSLAGAKWLAFALALAASAMPALTLENLSLVDYPAHLARFHVAATLPSDPWLAEIYELKTGFFPYYGMTLVMNGLMPFMGVEPAGRAFAAAAILMPAFGAIVLSRVIHGHVSWIALAAIAFSMNAVVGWGFLNFTFSIGIVLAAFAAWIALGRISLVRRTAIFVPLIIFTGCIHLLSAGILFGLIAAWELAGASGEGSSRAILRQVAPLSLSMSVLGLAVVLLSVASPADGVGDVSWAWGGAASRIEVVASAFAMGRGRIETLLGLAAAVPLYVAWREGLLVLAPQFGRMLMLVSAAALVAPVVLFGVYAMHIRLPHVALLIFVAALSPRQVASRSPLGMTLVACFVAVSALHFAVGTTALAGDSRRVTELRQAAQIIPRGARVLPAIDIEGSRTRGPGPAQVLFHLCSYLVIDRSVFLPTLFGLFELGVSPAYRDLFPEQASPTKYADLVAAGSGKPAGQLARWEQLEAYDYVVVLAPGSGIGRPAGTSLAHEGTWFEILKIDGRREAATD